ncbi:hypothetical protein M409DRAFT_30335 [Zasmidium cellare ATCC 36951]|uniref:Fork-head domain-containing protein n=1 Tax=Zasmidium cellare ATCC 36951 TaxID=1080233 RepID=A0A6A6BWW6_ZASCE|nr:uncharacterized protein M409DRAFT_30335 [Zasmidium cellare ATCC 36951]KAF2159195.1 hypothetical protein M409DRAFT_30335 [Zasmidium cellare ATCC 36951]
MSTPATTNTPMPPVTTPRPLLKPPARPLQKQEQERLDALQEARKPLRREIRKLITTFRDDPNFTAAELTLMAIIDNENEYSGRRDILRWIHDTFPVYKTDLIDAMLNSIYVNDPRPWNVTTSLALVRPDFDKVFKAYDVPLASGMYRNAWTTDVNAARIFLRHRLEPARKGAFRFLDLAAESRNRVYEMLLIFPGHTIRVGCETWHRDMGLNATARDFESHARAQSASKGEVPMDDLKTVLSITVACNQTASEALSIFYGENTFDFSSLISMELFLRQTSPRRLKLVKKGRFRISASSNINRAHDRELKTAYEVLHRHVSLDLLNIEVSSNPVKRRPQDPPIRRYESVSQMLEVAQSLYSLAKLASKAKVVSVFAARNARSDLVVEVEKFITDEVERMRGETEEMRGDAESIKEEPT